MNRNSTKLGIALFLAIALLAISATFTQAQDRAERTEEADQVESEAEIQPTQPAEERPSEEQPTEPDSDQSIDPTAEEVIDGDHERPLEPTNAPEEVLPTVNPIEVLPTIESPAQPTEVLPTENRPEGERTEVVLPVVQPPLPTTGNQVVGIPFHEAFGSDQGWISTGSWSFLDDGQGSTGWFADTASGVSEGTLEYSNSIALNGLSHPQLVLRQQGILSSGDVVAVEVRPIDGEWMPVDVQIGNQVAGDWSARFVDLMPFTNQTIDLRLRVNSTASGEMTRGYWIDELAIVEYTEPPVAATAVRDEIYPTEIMPVIPTNVPVEQPIVQPITQHIAAPQAVAAAVAVGTGLTGRYFDNADFTSRIVTRTDPTVNFYWHENAPANGVAPDTFSVRWVGQIVPRYNEVYTFYTNSDDGVRLWVDSQQLVDNWTNHGPTENSGTIALTAGVPYAIRIEYYDNDVSATMALSWSSTSQPKEIVPQSQLFPATTSAEPAATSLPTNTPLPTSTPVATTSGTGLTANYYNNSDFTNRVTTRVDSNVNFYWHENAPAPNVGPDSFSTRWTGYVVPRYSEVYTFYTMSDDGVRLWINGHRIIDNWTNHGPTENSGTIELVAGRRYRVRLDYYDNNVSATMALSWSSPHQTKQVIPRSRLYPDTSGTPEPTATFVPSNTPLATSTVVLTNTAVATDTALPTTTPVPVATGVPNNGSGTGLGARYFDNLDLTNLLVTRTDPTINFNWSDGSPAAEIAPDSFSVRWDGQLMPRYSEVYTFYTNSDDGVRLWVNGQPLVDNWTNHGPTENSGTIALVAGQRYDIRLEYYDYNVYSVVSLSWSSVSQPKEIVPQTQLFPATITNPLPTSTSVPTNTSLPTNTAVPTNTPQPANTPLPIQTQPPSSGSIIPAPPALDPARGTVLALWDWSDPNIQIYPQPNGAPEIGPVSSNDVAADGQGAYTRIVDAEGGDRVVEFMVNHDYVQRSYGTAARLFIRNWGYLQPYYGREIQTDFYMRVPQLPVVPTNDPNLVFGLGQQFKHADGVIWAMDAERAPDGSGVSPWVWWAHGTGVVAPEAAFEYQQGVWHKVRVNSLLHNSNGWVEIRIDDQLVFRFDGNTSETWGGGIGLALYIRDITGEMRVQFSDWRLQVL